MNDTRWGMASLLLFLGVAFLVGGSVACAAAAPEILRDLTIVDMRHLWLHLEPGAILLSVAGGCMVGALICALALGGRSTPPTIRAPQAWNALWQVRWQPLDARMFSSGLHAREEMLPADLSELASLRVGVTFSGREAAFAPSGEAVALALGERAPAFAAPTLRHARVRG